MSSSAIIIIACIIIGLLIAIPAVVIIKKLGFESFSIWNRSLYEDDADKKDFTDRF